MQIIEKHNCFERGKVNLTYHQMFVHCNKKYGSNIMNCLGCKTKCVSGVYI